MWQYSSIEENNLNKENLYHIYLTSSSGNSCVSSLAAKPSVCMNVYMYEGINVGCILRNSLLVFNRSGIYSPLLWRNRRDEKHRTGSSAENSCMRITLVLWWYGARRRTCFVIEGEREKRIRDRETEVSECECEFDENKIFSIFVFNFEFVAFCCIIFACLIVLFLISITR